MTRCCDSLPFCASYSHRGRVERRALNGVHAGGVLELAVGWRYRVPVELVQDHVLSRRDPGRRIEQRYRLAAG